MKGYVARKADRWYAVVYEGLDPATGLERRGWHAAGTERADAEKPPARLASERNGRNDQTRSLSFGAYLIRQWLPGKRVMLAASTYAGYHRNVVRHILPALGRVALRGLRPHHLEALYDRLPHPGDGRVGLAPKTVYEVHLGIRGALAAAVRRGLVSRNVALVAHAPRPRSIPKVEQQAWTAEELPTFLRAATGHRLFAALWVAAFTGMAATSCSACGGTTSTPPTRPCRSTAGSWPSPTKFTRLAARPATPVDVSTSTPPPSVSSPRGATGNTPNSEPSASSRQDGCSPTAKAR
jgi:hypothetical protein